MIRKLTGLFLVATERRARDFLLGVLAAAVVVLFVTISLGFGTFAAYVYLCASEGRFAAALIVCAAYGLFAIAIWATGVARRRACRLRRAAAATNLASSENVDALLQSLSPVGTSQDRLALVVAMRLGRELSPMQLLVLALIGGLIAGRALRRV